MVKYGLKRLNIEISSKCNYHCLGCPNPALSRGNGNMPARTVNNIFRELGNDIEKVYLWNYGEPLLHPQITSVLEQIRDYSCYKAMSTNGALLENFENLHFLTSLDELIVTISGLDEETYHMYQRGGNFQKVLRGIRKTANVLGKSKTKFIMQFLLTKWNLHQCKEVPIFSEKAGFHDFYLKSFNVMDMNQSTFEMFVPADTNFSRYKTHNPVTRPRQSTIPHPCTEWMVINWDGSVNPCCWDYEGKFVLGNVHQSSIYDIWNSAVAQKHREEIKSGTFHDFCIDCLVNPRINKEILTEKIKINSANTGG
jgi:radical SAM protein with 4Fe4S-binding SPASM domain